jgi:hypothetical protein
MEWKTITGTSNGEKLFALVFNEDTGDRRIYESIDRGGSWTILHTLPAGITPNRMRCSGDGRYIVLDDTSTKSNGAHYSSSDFGVTFIVRILQSGIGNGSTNGLCMSRSGAIQYMVFRGDFESIIYRSFNYGVTWSVGLYIPRFDDNNVDKGYLTSLECCALGKFIYAPRFVAFNTATTTGYRSNNYGANWNETGLGTATNFWVSGTGQFVVATSIPVSVPVVGSVNVFYSTDYGLSFLSVSLGVPTSSSIAGSANGEILVIVSKSITENTFTGDGRIRLFRQGEIDEIYTSYPDPITGQWLTTNSKLALAPAVQLWATTDYRPSNTNIYFINFFPNKIDMRYYNIQYEFEFFWERGGATYPQTYLSLGLNSLYAANASAQTSTRKSSATSWTFESPKFSTEGTTYNFPQNFVDRFYAGFAPLSPANLLNEYRMRTILKGELSLNFRSIGDVAFNSGQADNSINERVINNNFSCTNYTTEYYSPTQWGIFHQNDDAIQYSQQTMNGNAVWNASLGGVWTSGSANDRMDNGIHQLFIASTNTQYGAQIRPCQVKGRVFRVRK